MKLPLSITATLAIVTAGTQVLACYVDNHNALCVASGNSAGNFSYPRVGHCNLTYTTPGIATANWVKDDVAPSGSGRNGFTGHFQSCIGPYKTYNSCISAYENWNAGDNSFQSSPVTWTVVSGGPC